MYRTMLKSKIHRAAVTFTDKDYEGSISIDRDIMDKANLLQGEKVLVADIDNGERFETYVIEAERGSREIGVNGAAAHLVELKHRVIILAFAGISEEEVSDHRMRIVVLNERNEIINELTKGV